MRMNRWYRGTTRCTKTRNFTIKACTSYCTTTLCLRPMRWRTRSYRWWGKQSGRSKLFSLITTLWSNLIEPSLGLLRKVLRRRYWPRGRETSRSSRVCLIISFFRGWFGRGFTCRRPRRGCCTRRCTWLIRSVSTWGRWTMTVGVGRSIMRSIFPLKIGGIISGWICTSPRWWLREGRFSRIIRSRLPGRLRFLFGRKFFIILSSLWTGEISRKRP